ncbi:Serine/threonine-protein kinase Smg1 [Strongyloides ratti]|uniref:Serine/threonine-protein kinase Smg1 n=1 Tax=Strongyloides ratti TaxID=34506 RepID=A0A090L7S4_STRRB|nr:Serine/threonine-protein kinase Smg1 [Strongyloides ratti]CEF65777.1 Serine/threonine-protein kinase Smg1 [Strongyloides ratti]
MDNDDEKDMNFELNLTNDFSSLCDIINDVIRDDLITTHPKVKSLVKNIRKISNLNEQFPKWIEICYELIKTDLFYSSRIMGERCYRKIYNQFFKIASNDDIKEWCSFISNNIDNLQKDEEMLNTCIKVLNEQKIDGNNLDDVNSRFESVLQIFQSDDYALGRNTFLKYLRLLNHLTIIFQKKTGSIRGLNLWEASDTFNFLISYAMDYTEDIEIQETFDTSLQFFKSYWISDQESITHLGITIYNDMIAYMNSLVEGQSLGPVNCLFKVICRIVETYNEKSLKIFFDNVINSKKIIKEMDVLRSNESLLKIFLLLDFTKEVLDEERRFNIMSSFFDCISEPTGEVLICILALRKYLPETKITEYLLKLTEDYILFQIWNSDKLIYKKSIETMSDIINNVEKPGSMLLYKEITKKISSLLFILQKNDIEKSVCEETERNIVCFLRILEKLFTKKHNIMVFMSYQPSFFNFLFKNLTIPWRNIKKLSKEFVFYIVTLQRDFSYLYDHYISNYVWEEEGGNSSILQLSPSSNYFYTVLSTLTDYCNNFHNMGYDSVFSIVKWIMKIFYDHEMIVKKNFNQLIFKKFRFYLSSNLLILVSSFDFDRYFGDKAYFYKYGPYTQEEESLAVNLINGAQLLLERCQWHLNNYGMTRLQKLFLQIVRKCDHTQFIYLMKIVPSTFILSYSLSRGYLPPEQKFTNSTCFITTREDFIRIMDFIYKKIDMGINFQRDIFLKWVERPMDLFNADCLGIKYSMEYWNLICVGIAMYLYNEQFITPVGCMWKTLLFMEETSTVLLTEINESLGIESSDGDDFINYKLELQDEMIEKTKNIDVNGEGNGNNFNVDYEYSFEYEGMDHIYNDRKPLYEEAILRFSLWIKIIFNVLTCFEVSPKDVTEPKDDDKVVKRNIFIRENEYELRKAFQRIIIPIIKISYRIGHYGTCLKLSESIIRLADPRDFYDSKKIEVSEDIRKKIDEVLPIMVMSYLKTSSSQSLKGIKKYFETTFGSSNLYWIDDIDNIVQGKLEKGLANLEIRKNVFYQNYIDEMINEFTGVLNYYKDEKKMKKEHYFDMEDDKKNDINYRKRKEKLRKKKKNDKLVNFLNNWDSLPKEPVDDRNIVYDIKKFTNVIEGNVLATYECFIDLRNVALKKYNKILWKSSELFQTIGHYALTLQSNSRLFSSAYCSHLITEDVKKRLTLRLNKVPFSEDIELPLKLVNSKVLEENLMSSPIECLEIGKKLSWWFNHCGHYVHASISSSFYIDIAKMAIKTDNEYLAREQLNLFKKTFSKINKYEYPLESFNGSLTSIDYDIKFKDKEINFKHLNQITKTISLFMDHIFEKSLLQRIGMTNTDFIEGEINQLSIIPECNNKSTFCKKQLDHQMKMHSLSKGIIKMGNIVINSNENIQKFTEALADSTSIPMIHKLIKPYIKNYHSMIEYTDMATNVFYPAFLTLSTRFSPTYAKPYLMLAEYVFDKGTKGLSDQIPVTVNEENQLKQHLKFMLEYFNEEDFNKLFNVVLSTNTTISLRINIISFIKQFPLYRSEAEIFADNIMNDVSFITLFTKICTRQVKYFSISTKAYEQYLSLCNTSYISSDIIRSVLNIHKMIILCPPVISRLVTSMLKKVNEDIWKNILPQLFPRLSHPNRFVRECIYNILESVAKTSPHVLVFPIVVAKNNVKDEDMYFNTLNKAKFNSINSVSKEKEKLFIAEYCTRLSNFIEEKYPGLIGSVTKFVDETKKINMLIDDKWVHVLSKCESEIKKKLSAYCNYLKKGSDNRIPPNERMAIGKEKYKILTNIIYQALNDLYDFTFNKKFESEYEENFVTNYGKIIKEAFEQYKILKNESDPFRAFIPFQDLLKYLCHLKNVKQQKLNLKDLNESLYNMESGIVPLPGQDMKRYSDPSFVSIEKISSVFTVIQSLTRPKKVEFHGNDGSSHFYLVKGYEDMHLDERLQQILRIYYPYRAKNYSVTPIGARSGLIKYVGEADQMFTPYYNWLQKNKDKFDGDVPDDVNASKRARQFFIGRVKKYLNCNNDKITDINEFRLKENTEAFVKAFNDVSDIVPKNTLTNKIQKVVVDGDHWYHVTKTYSRSVAVMSMIGWLFGVGDRHLSNIMIIYLTGEILHIDFNVCFGKLKNLKCPEKVPFRMTRSMVDVMGPMKTEGIFKESCKFVLKCLRENYDILYNILETYAYDPLADWSSVSEVKNQGESLPLDIMFAIYGRSVFEPKELVERSFGLFKIKVMEISLIMSDYEKMVHDVVGELVDIYKKENQLKNSWNNDNFTNQVNSYKLHNIQKLLESFSSNIQGPLTALSVYNNQFNELEKLLYHELIPKVKKTCMLIIPQEYNYELNIERMKMLNEIMELSENSIKKIKELSTIKVVFNEENMYSLKRDSRHCDVSSQMKNECAVSIINDVKSRFNRLFYDNIKDNETPIDDSNIMKSENKEIVENRLENLVTDLIDEATDINNLAVMFEGWAAWV